MTINFNLNFLGSAGLIVGLDRNLSFTGNDILTDNALVEIIHTRGTIIQHFTATNQITLLNISIPGLYIVKVTENQNISIRKLIVK